MHSTTPPSAPPMTTAFSGLRWRPTKTHQETAAAPPSGKNHHPPASVPLKPRVVTAAGLPVFEQQQTAASAVGQPLPDDEGEREAARLVQESIQLEVEAQRLGEEEGRWEEALAKWESAVALTPGRAGPHEGRARAALRLSQPQPRLAVGAAGQAAYLDPSSSQAFLTLGRAQLACGEPFLALRSFHTVLRLDPTHTTLHEDMLHAEKLVQQQKLQEEEREEKRLAEEAERIQLELKRKKDCRRAAASHWYEGKKEQESTGANSSLLVMPTEGLQQHEEDEDDDDEEEELEGGYSRDEWEELRSVLEEQGSKIMHDFHCELARKREQDRIERLREREEEEEEDEEDE